MGTGWEPGPRARGRYHLPVDRPPEQTVAAPAAPRHAAPPAAPVVPAAPAGRSTFRGDIQALRALAVVAVVLNHLWPLRLTGGYVGVDVFFVISGFLITSHLNKEIAATGRVKLGAFYARRILRLLPAAFLVIGTSLVAVRVFLPYSQWTNNARELFASATYVENWVLAARSVDYSAQNEAATVAQHYWSLSVEEQFYLVWPLLLVGASWLARRYAQRHGRHVLPTVLGVVALASLAVCVVVTGSSPNQAYFVTPVRVWEFALGGLLAVVASRVAMGRAVAQVASVAGFLLIAGSCVAFGTGTAFPGWAALVPTLGAALVVLAGSAGHALAHERVTGLRPIQFLGDVSYSLYLWHWPLIVVAPFVLGHTLTTTAKIAIAVVALALAWLTKVLVEDPARQWRWARARTARAMVAMVAGIAVVGAASGALLVSADRHGQIAVEREEARASDDCAGPRALANPSCPDPFGPADDVAMSETNQYWNDAYWNEEDLPGEPTCVEEKSELPGGTPMNFQHCDHSGGDPDAPSIWLVGDSHVQEWERAVFVIAEERGWRVTLAYRGACPPAIVAYAEFRGDAVSPADATGCLDWTRGVQRAVLDDAPDLVLTAAFTREEKVDDGSGRSQDEQYRDGFHEMWQPWIDAGTRVVAIADPPLNAEVRDPECVALNPGDPLVCTVPRDVAAPPDPIVHAGHAVDGADVVDLTNSFCDAATCYAVVGKVPVFYDPDHINGVYAQLLAPDLEAQLPPLG